VLIGILERASFVGTWLTCREVSLMREFERKALLLRLDKAKWIVDPDHRQLIRAHRSVSAEQPWPFGTDPALPWPQSEVLVVGSRAESLELDCRDERDWRSKCAVRGDALVLHTKLASLLVDERCYAVSVGRT
jgi:hypothetical protein